MTTYNLYTFGAHPLEPPRPCHASSTSDRPCQHVKDTSRTLKPTFCPLALCVIQHFVPMHPIQIIDALAAVFQIGDSLWFPSLRFNTHMTFHGGRIRPKPGIPALGLDHVVEGSAEVHGALLEDGHRIVGVAPGTLQGEPLIILFSNGELRELRYDTTTTPDDSSQSGRLVLDELNTTEVQAIESSGLRYGRDELVGIAQTVAAGPITLLTRTGSVFELPWKDMSTAQQYPGGRKSLTRPVVEICSGWNKIVARTEDSEVWNWHANQDPVRVNIPESEDIVSVRAGGRLGTAVTKDGEVWAWALTRPDIGQEHKNIAGAGTDWMPRSDGMIQPGKLQLPAGVKVHSISVGAGYLAIKSEEGVWYTAGEGAHGQLGIGEKLLEIEGNADKERGDEYIRHFTEIDFDDSDIKDLIDLGCGGNVTWVVAVDKE